MLQTSEMLLAANSIKNHIDFHKISGFHSHSCSRRRHLQVSLSLPYIHLPAI